MREIFFILLLAVTFPPNEEGSSEDLAPVQELIEARRFGEALTVIEADFTGEAGPRVLELRSRCEYEIGSWAACETSLQALIAQLEKGSAEWVAQMTRLARVQLLQGIHGEALSTAERVIEHGPNPEILRTAIRSCLRAREYERARPFVDQLLVKDSTDTVARYYRGLVLAKSGQPEQALDDLRHGTREPGLGTEARFELALALGQIGRPRQALEELCEVVERDPYHAEACYQASRQLIRRGSRPAFAVAGRLVRYFQSLRELEGPGSRDRHLEAEGDIVGAALVRATRWERLGALDRTLDELIRARGIRAGSTRLALHLGEFWTRQGLLGEAARELARARELIGRSAPAPDFSERLRSLDTTLERAQDKLSVDTETPLSGARRALAAAPWGAAEPALLALLNAAQGAGRPDVSLATARLLLARNPRSAPALGELARRTTDPALLVPHLHYLRQLAELTPGDTALATARARAREIFFGERAP